MYFSWPLNLAVYLVEYIVVIKFDWHFVSYQRWHTLIMSWNCLEGLKHALSFYNDEKRPKSFYCSAQRHSVAFFLVWFLFFFSCRCEKIGNLVSLFSRINHHNNWRKRKKKKKAMVDCLFVATQEYVTEILYLVIKFGGNAGTSLTVCFIIIHSEYFPVSDWLKAHP